MSRSGYSDDYNEWAVIRWRGAVASAIRGKRGQTFLREMIVALDAMPNKRLIADELISESGEVCALGSVGKKRGFSMTNLDPHHHRTLADFFRVAQALVQEIEFMNDEAYGNIQPALRWQMMRDWAVSNLLPVDLIEIEA